MVVLEKTMARVETLKMVVLDKTMARVETLKMMVLVKTGCVVCVSNYNCSPHTVDVFDSIRVFSVNSSSLKNQIAAILKTPASSFNINFIDVQTQMGLNDCGIFAIAFAVALCSGRDPHMET